MAVSLEYGGQARYGTGMGWLAFVWARCYSCVAFGGFVGRELVFKFAPRATQRSFGSWLVNPRKFTAKKASKTGIAQNKHCKYTVAFTARLSCSPINLPLQRQTVHAVAFKMVAGGLVTVGVVMYKAYAALAGAARASSAPTFGVATLAAALAAAGGPAGIAAAATVAVGYFVLSKDAVNDLLLTNDSKFRIIFNGDHIQNGERAFKVDGIPARVDLADGTVAAYPCGAYVYRKYRMGFLGAFGPRGSLFGIRFYAHRGDLADGFSVGMDCPNTAAGGRNSILCIADTAMVASGGASARGDEGNEATTTHGKITGRRADAWGDVNYGFAVFESTA
ncbi:hypothetical protein BJ138DRAFT_1102519 [Hygrophoropsis aurantiaca]|uniref:Uncharacterized protein n=1 Tax=Hygrophoropsis aurantiaca TaxID=72124 RepID=A0ACB8AAE6_9AGAM|nr:hypothetical protein BJ138DRAFT_1102519 [Hygrophoropsis aurantiaca]